MANYQSEVQKLVEGFVSALTEIWRRQAIDSLTGMGGGRSGGGGGGQGGGGARPASPGISLGRGRGRGAKRTQDELDQLADAFVDFVSKNPGLRIEQINKQLGTSTKDLALPIRKLLADGVVKAKGKKRSTAYFPGDAQKKKGKN